jgi:hypothetical protein
VLDNESPTLNSKISIWPNPFSSQIHIQQSVQEKNNIIVQDILGNTMVEVIDNTNDVWFDTSTWPVGMYILKYENKAMSKTIKLLKK